MFAANEWSGEYKMEPSVSSGAGSPSRERQHFIHTWIFDDARPAERYPGPMCKLKFVISSNFVSAFQTQE